VSDYVPPEDDVVEHLWNAAHELLRAMRKVVDAAEEFVDQQQRRPRPRDADHGSRLHHIDIDADTDAG
jgi:hypothetical protein